MSGSLLLQAGMAENARTEVFLELDDMLLDLISGGYEKSMCDSGNYALTSTCSQGKCSPPTIDCIPA